MTTLESDLELLVTALQEHADGAKVSEVFSHDRGRAYAFGVEYTIRQLRLLLKTREEHDKTD
jgi:hypothetical protein